MKKNIHSIVCIFPEFEEKIESLFMKDANFRDLCEDYILCANSMLDIKKEMDKYREQVVEYEVVQLNLEQEILQMISKKG